MSALLHPETAIEFKRSVRDLGRPFPEPQRDGVVALRKESGSYLNRQVMRALFKS